MIPFITYQMAHVQIVHAEVRKTVSDGKPFTKHHQSSQRQSLSASLSVLSIATKISKESLVVNPVPNVGTILLPELSAVLTQGP